MFETIDWNSVRLIGFDLDGTLYDEYLFITQVYKPISSLIAESLGEDDEIIYNRMLSRWKEKGSSYNRIFDELLLKGGIADNDRSIIINKCLHIFRNFEPNLRLDPFVCEFLDWASNSYQIFIVSDGNHRLQNAKIISLDLHRWFLSSNISISGSFTPSISKPNVLMASKIHILKPIILNLQKWFTSVIVMLIVNLLRLAVLCLLELM